MAKIICSKCGMTGISKCPYCRNVFSDNQMDAVLSYEIRSSVSEDGKWLRMSFAIHDNKTKEETLDGAIQTLSLIKNQNGNSEHLKYPTIKEFLCDHKWVFAPGEHSDIGCGHDI